tara:strand:+ start:372 stop:734 length:363 start_codon:yes stop_codon:yes gene_type:complete
MIGKSKKEILDQFNNELKEYRIGDSFSNGVKPYEFTEASKIFITGESYLYLRALDKTFVGTSSYMGFAYFWGQEYKHTLREANNTQRQRVHNALIKAGIDLGSESPEYEAIVKKYCKSVK